jgi:predicted transcriptional regulator
MSMVLRLDTQLDKLLGHAAVDQGTTKSALIRQALAAYFANDSGDSDE